MQTRSTTKRVQQSNHCYKLQTIAEVKPDIVNNKQFQHYLKQLRQYWKEKERNENKTKFHKTFKHTLPKPLKILTKSQKELIESLAKQHKRNMLKNSLWDAYCNKSGSGKFSQTLRANKELKELYIQDKDMSKYCCPCCMCKDYIPPTTKIALKVLINT